MSFVFVLFAAAEIFAGIEVSLNKSELFVGDDVEIECTVTLPADCTIVRPEYNCILNWYVKDIILKQNKTGGANNVYGINIVATTFNPGQRDLPSIKIDYFDKNGKKYFFSSKPVNVTVKNILSDNEYTANLKDIKSVKILHIDSGYYYILAGFSCYFLLVFFLYLKNNINLNKLLSKLEKIKENKRNKSLRFRYKLLYRVIKQFVKLQYDIDANKTKSRGIIYQLTKTNLSQTALKKILKILENKNFNADDFAGGNINDDIDAIIDVLKNIIKDKDLANKDKQI